MGGTAQTLFTLGFVKSPIILCNGIASAIPGQMLPIIALTQAADFTTGLLSGSISLNPDSFFANFWPLPGGTLVSQQIGQYPFANQAVAANATIAQPLKLSVMMTIVAKEDGDMITKLITMTALKAALDLHNNSGGTYTVATPTFTYINGILIELRDNSLTNLKQAQNQYQWDFEFPLITQQQATTALGNQLYKISNGLVSTNTIWSSVANSIGIPTSAALTATQPVASGLTGAAVSGIAPSGNP